MMAEQYSAADKSKRRVKRALRRAHREYHQLKPDLSERIPQYLEATLSDGSSELQAQFDQYAGLPDPWLDKSKTAQGSITKNALSTEARTIDTSSIVNVPKYRFCRPSGVSVSRPNAHFTKFTPTIIKDKGSELEYANQLKCCAWVYDEPDRSGTDTDIIAREAFYRLEKQGMPIDVINGTRLLPLHGDILVDLELLRDLPSFPKIENKGKWGNAVFPAVDSFEDAEDIFGDVLADFCRYLGCQTFDCAAHLEPLSSRPTVKPPLEDASKANRPRKNCSKQCGLRRLTPPTPWLDIDIDRLKKYLKLDPDAISCDLVECLPSYTCAQIASKILESRKSRRSTESATPDTETPSAARGCDCHKRSIISAGGLCLGANCKCRNQGLECIPQYCHPRTDDEDWCSPVGANTAYLAAKNCCSNAASSRVKKRSDMIRVDSSRIAGYGLFAKTTIPKGETLCEYVGEIIPGVENDNRMIFYDHLGSNYFFALGVQATIDAAFIGNEFRFTNDHPDKSRHNMSVTCSKAADQLHILFSTTKKILPGEELLLDYGNDYWKKLGMKRAEEN